MSVTNRTQSGRRVQAAILFGITGWLWAAPAAAYPCTTMASPGGWFSSAMVSGQVDPSHAGDIVSVTFSGTTKTVQVATGGSWSVITPASAASGAAYTVSKFMDCDDPSAPLTGTVAELFTPPRNEAVARHTILPGSTVTIGGGAFALTGGFSLVATAIDYDPASPTYGLLSGFMPAAAFAVDGIGVAGTAELRLTGDAPFAVDLAPVLAGATTAAWSVPIAGSLLFGGEASPVAGVVTGVSTYGAGGAERYTFGVTLASAFGPVTGAGSSDGAVTLTAVPEPGGATLLLAGLPAVMWRRRARRRSASAMSRPR